MAFSPLAANAATQAPAPVAYSLLVQEIKDKKVEQLQFGNDEKSVMVKTVDGATQIVAVLPTAQVPALARTSVHTCCKKKTPRTLALSFPWH